MGTWSVKSMNKVDMKWSTVIARVNQYILGNSELKWTGMGKFNQMTIMSTTVGRNPLEEMD